MKRIHLFTGVGLAIGLGTPLALVLAATFGGPPNCTTPPCNNVPGVIWNVAGTAASQPSAEINIPNGKLLGQIISDIALSDTKALRIDKNGTAVFNIGNWGGAGGSSKPLNFTVYGGARAIGITANPVLGEDGRMQGDKFCFNPGNPSDCITSWPSGATGNYVSKYGDSLYGTLSSATNTISASDLQAQRHFKIQPTQLTGYTQTGGYMTPLNNSHLEIMSNEGKRNVKFMTNAVAGNVGTNALQIRVDRSTFPTITGMWIDSQYGGNSDRTLQFAQAGGVLGFTANTEGTANQRVGGYIGYCPVGSQCRGINISAQGTQGDTLGALISHTSGTAALISDGNNGSGFYGNWNNGTALRALRAQTGIYTEGSRVGLAAFSTSTIGSIGTGVIPAEAYDTGIYAKGTTAGLYADAPGYTQNAGIDPSLTPATYGGSFGLMSTGKSFGVLGRGNVAGVAGFVTQTIGGSGGAGVSGYDYSGAIGAVGVSGYSMSPNGAGVVGQKQGANGYAVTGYATDATGKGGYFISNGLGSVSIGLPAGAIAISTTTLSSNPDTYWVPAAANGSGLYARGTSYAVYSDGLSKFTGKQDPLLVIDHTPGSGGSPAIHLLENGATKAYVWANAASGDLNFGSPTKNSVLVVKTGGGVLMTNYSQFISPDGTKNFQLDTNNAGDFEIIPSVGGWAKRLWVNGTTGDLQIVGGRLYAAAADVISDRRLKNVKGEYTRGLTEILNLNPTRFTFKSDVALLGDKADTNVGFIAQEVEQVIPEAVKIMDDANQTRALDPMVLTTTLVNAVKEQQEQINALRTENAELKSRLDRIEAKLK